MRIRLTLSTLSFCLWISGLAHAGVAPEEEAWRFRITPYLWAPSVEGSLKIDGIGGDTEDEGGSALDYLSGAAMVTFEAKRGDWSIIGDLLWAEFELEGTLDGPLATSFEAENDELVIGLGAARALWCGETAQVEGIVGLRYFHADVSLDSQSGAGDLAGSADLLDPIVGLRGRVGDATGLFGMAYADVGGFGVSSDLTWQALGGVGWAWSACDVQLGWREIAYDFDSGGILYDLTAGGPFLGVSFEF